MRQLECLLVNNECYQLYHDDYLIPEGIIVHSSDKAGGVLKRYVQPAAGQTKGLKDGEKTVTAAEMQRILGTNIYGNSWNRPACYGAPHAAIGKLADGSYAVCKTLDYTQPCWGVAFGSKGSYDGRIFVNGKKVAGGHLYIQFEMIEDGNSPSKSHAKALYDNAVEFSAYLCEMFPTIKNENIISHKEANARGYGSAHGDPEAYWKRAGVDYTMAKFRADVKAKLAEDEQAPAEPGTIYRVQVGAFRNKAYADDFLKQVHKVYPNAYLKKGGG